MSAIAPAGSVSRKKGSEAMVEISEIKNMDELSVFIVQVAAVSCADTQIPDTMLVNQSLRNTGFLNESQMEVLLIQDFVA
jgi:hypothetical protein